MTGEFGGMVDRHDEHSTRIPTYRSGVKRQRRPPTCNRCKNHGITNIELKGHKNHCDFQLCCCPACSKLVDRQDKTADQVFAKRFEKTAKERRAMGLPVRPLPPRRSHQAKRSRLAYVRGNRSLMSEDHSMSETIEVSDMESVRSFQSNRHADDQGNSNKMDHESNSNDSACSNRTGDDRYNGGNEGNESKPDNGSNHFVASNICGELGSNRNSCCNCSCHNIKSNDSKDRTRMSYISNKDFSKGSRATEDCLETNSNDGESVRGAWEWLRNWTKVRIAGTACSAGFKEGMEELNNIVWMLYREDPRATVCAISEFVRELGSPLGLYGTPTLVTPPSTPPTLRSANSAAAQPGTRIENSRTGGETDGKPRKWTKWRDHSMMSSKKESKSIEEEKTAWKCVTSVASTTTKEFQQIIAHNSITSTFPLAIPGFNPLSMCTIPDGIMKGAYPALDYLCAASAAKRAAFSIDHLSRSSITSENISESRDWSKIGMGLPRGKTTSGNEIQSTNDYSILLAASPVHSGSFWFQPTKQQQEAAAVAAALSAAEAAGMLPSVPIQVQHLEQLQQLRYTRN